MDFSVKMNLPAKQSSDCLILGVFEGSKLSEAAERFNTASEGALGKYLAKGDLEATLGSTLLLQEVPHTQSDRILLVSCGPKKELNDKEFRELLRKTVSALHQTGVKEAVCFLTELVVKKRDIAWKTRQIVQLFLESTYRFDAFKSKKDKVDTKGRRLKRVLLMAANKSETLKAQRAIVEAQAIVEGLHFVKDLGNCPPNICTPRYLAKTAENLAASHSAISTAVLDEKEIKALKMGALLAVGQGSQEPPRLITLEYRGRNDKQKPIVLVGKGITFDTGGNSLKPPVAMIGMKFDMCGAATVLGVIKAAALLELPLNIVGVIAAAENMPGGSASRPDDIVISMSGISIEILNTDAEGRLVLCDALTYCERFKPDVVIDIATLTGACAVALGQHASGLLSNHAPLAKDLLEAGQNAGDRCWELPLWEDYQEALNSACADIANIGTPAEAGTILGACFLQRFAKDYHWAHLDVAATASKGNAKDRSATGRPLPLLMQYLLDRAQKANS